MSSPREAILGVTWRCNARCKICSVWSRKSGTELSPEDYSALPPSLRQVSLGGYGEPFLRKDFYKIVEVIRKRCPRARIVIVTNGIMPDIIIRQVRKMPRDISIRISLDGIGQTHDNVRGIKGAFEKAKKTLTLLREHGVKDLGIGLVISSLNDSEIEKVFDFTRENNVSFTCTIVQSSEVTFGQKDEYLPDPARTTKAIEKVEAALLKGFSVRDWATAYFLDGIRDQLKGNPRKIRCLAGKEFFYMDPSGDIFPCNILNMKMGAMHNGNFPSIARENGKILDYVTNCPRQCWMTCTVTPSMMKRPLKPVMWTLRSRLFGPSF